MITFEANNSNLPVAFFLIKYIKVLIILISFGYNTRVRATSHFIT
jgi:hypothetical protein